MSSEPQTHGGYAGVGRVLILIPLLLVLALVIVAEAFGSRYVFAPPPAEAGAAQLAHAPPPGPPSRGG